MRTTIGNPSEHDTYSSGSLLDSVAKYKTLLVGGLQRRLPHLGDVKPPNKKLIKEKGWVGGTKQKQVDTRRRGTTVIAFTFK